MKDNKNKELKGLSIKNYELTDEANEVIENYRAEFYKEHKVKISRTIAVVKLLELLPKSNFL